MPSGAQTAPVSKGRLWAGRIISALPVLLLLFSGVLKLIKPVSVVQGFARYGYPDNLILVIGLLELSCTIAYAIPRTAVLGAILLTGYLGGTVATHLRVDSPVFSHMLYGVYLGIMLWGGLFLRDDRLRALIPYRH